MLGGASDTLLDPLLVPEKPPKRIALAVVLVLLNQIGNVASGELLQFQETNGDQKYNNPYFSIWFNNSVTGLGCLVVVAAQLAVQQTTLSELLLASGYLGVELVWDAVFLAALFQAFNVCMAESISSLSISVFLAISQSAVVPIFVLSCCFLSEKVGASGSP